MIYADYTYYIGTYGGTAINETEFYRLSRKASAYIDQITFGNAKAAMKNLPEEHETVERIRDACCAICENLQQEENGGEIASATNDGYSESYVTSSKTSEQKRYEIASMFLASTGLLYAGVRGCRRC